MENGNNRQQKSGNSKETVTTKAVVPPIVQAADDFTNKWTKNEIVVDFERAKDLQITETDETETNFLGRPKKKKHAFCNEIGFLIAKYQLYRDTGTPRELYNAAFELMSVVQKGQAFNAFKDTTQEQRNYEQEIERLNQQLESTRKLNDKLAKENKRLHNLLPDALRKKSDGNTEIGDVMAP